MAALANCYDQYERERAEYEGNEAFMDEDGDYGPEGTYVDEENDYSRPNDGRCSPEIPLVDKPPRKLPVKTFYRSATAQRGEASLPRDTTHNKSRNKAEDTVTTSRVKDLGDGRGRSKATLGQTPSRHQRALNKSNDTSSCRY